MESLFDLHPLGPTSRISNAASLKLQKINAALMQRVEKSMDQQANAYSLFQTAITLEGQVRVRTEEVKQCAVAARAHQRRAVERTRCLRARQPLQDALLHRRRPRSAAAAARGAPFGQRARRAERQRASAPPRRAHRARADDDRGAAEVHPRHLQARGRRRSTPALRPVALDELFASLIARHRAAGARRKNLSLTWRAQQSRGRLRSADAAPHPAEPAGQRGAVHGARAASGCSRAGAGPMCASRSGTPAPASAGRARDDLRGIPARAGDRSTGHRRLRPRAVDRAAHGRDARTSPRPVLARRPRHAVLDHRAVAARPIVARRMAPAVRNCAATD